MKIVFLDFKTLGDVNIDKFNDFGEVEVYQTTTYEQTIDRIKDADIIITNKVVIDSYMMDNSNLKLICVAATGMNNIDLEYAKDKAIEVKNVAGYSTNSVVSQTFAIYFHLAHSNNYYDDFGKNSWSSNDIFTHHTKDFFELENKKWGIIGLGEIGRGVAKVADAFGCEVCYYSTSGANNNSDYQRVKLDELMSSCDIISIHSPLNSQTDNLITYDKLSLMKSSAIILNLGRGGIINENDLAKAIDDEVVYKAGTDVTAKEPIPKDNPLLHTENKDRLFITPHIAWASVEARARLVEMIYQNISSSISKW
jgi:glycerate dehydrogenase